MHGRKPRGALRATGCDVLVDEAGGQLTPEDLAELDNASAGVQVVGDRHPEGP